MAVIIEFTLRREISSSFLNSILIRSHNMNNWYCRDFHVTDNMLQKFNIDMYGKPHHTSNENENDESKDGKLKTLLLCVKFILSY